MGLSSIFESGDGIYNSKKGLDGLKIGSIGTSTQGAIGDVTPSAQALNILTQRKLEEADARIQLLESDTRTRISAIEARVSDWAEASEKSFEQAIRSQEEEFRKRIDEVKEKTLTTLGIFVALFSFVSIDFQIFKTVTEWTTAVGLVFISGGLLACFALLVDLLVSSTFDRWKRTRFIVVSTLVGISIIIGLGFFIAPLKRVVRATTQQLPSAAPVTILQPERAATSSIPSLGTTPPE